MLFYLVVDARIHNPIAEGESKMQIIPKYDFRPSARGA